MIITCPQCSSSFDVPAGVIGADGRLVKCANCGHEWHQDNAEVAESENKVQDSPYKPLEQGVTATASEIDFDEDDSKEKIVVPEKDISEKKENQKAPFWKSAKILSGVLGFFVLSLLLILLKFTPLSHSGFFQKVYAGFGLVSMESFDGAGIDRIETTLFENDGVYSAEVKTKLINLTDVPINLNKVQIQVIDISGNPLDKIWTFDAPQLELAPAESVDFQALIDNIVFPDPSQTYTIQLSLI